jgi:voltage-gated potassium channel
MLKFRLLSYFKTLIFPLSLLGFAIVAGTIGYMIIEGFPFLDAVYMTVITIASVGYGETHPLSSEGRIFTIWLILFNLLSFTLFIAAVSRTFLDGELMREYKLLKMQTHIENLENHVIVCGFGRNGKEAAHVLAQKNTPFVVIEHKATRWLTILKGMRSMMKYLFRQAFNGQVR